MNIAQSQSNIHQLALALGVEALALAFMAQVSARSQPWTAIAGFTLAFGSYLLASPWRPWRCPAARWSDVDVPRATLWAGALLLRCVGLFQDPSFSDDLYRYLWEGRAGLFGLNPFEQSPASLRPLFPSDILLGLVNHPDIPSVYPPLAQRLFQGMAALWYAPMLPKLVFAACDLLTLWGLEHWVRPRAGARTWSRLAVYAWHPLPVVEYAGNGHLDSAAIAALVWGLALSRPDRPERAHSGPANAHAAWVVGGVLLGMGAWIKLLPALFLPAWLLGALSLPRSRRPGGTRGWMLLAGLLHLGLALVLLMPYRDTLPSLLAGLRAYAAHWSFNPSLFVLLEVLLGTHARAASGLLLLLWLVVRLTQRLAWDRLGQELTLGFFLLSPTAHPWYLLWTLPFLVPSPSRAILLLSLTVFFGYAVFDAPSGWEEKPWMPWVTYGPPCLLGIWDSVLGGWANGPTLDTSVIPVPEVDGSVDNPVDNSGEKGDKLA